TLPRAQAARMFMNYNLSELSIECREYFCKKLQNNWDKMFFELIVARTLQILGGTLQIEKSTPSGKNPDFLASFGSKTIIVEATFPVFQKEFQRSVQRDEPLLNIIEDFAPKGWSIMIHKLPNIGPADSKKEFKRTVKTLLILPPAKKDMGERKVKAKVSTGTVEFTLIPKRISHTAIISGPVYMSWSDAIQRIQRAVRKKRDQVRGAEYPVILAITTGFHGSFQDFDRALFGSTSVTLDFNHQPVKEEFITDGVFATTTKKEPTYAGVLAYREVGFHRPVDPILYIHPRFKGQLPKELGVLERRRLDREKGVDVTQASGRSLLEELHPIPWNL
ncbi:MAG: hypothetical protein ACE5HX_14205, partial [bacterium]